MTLISILSSIFVLSLSSSTFSVSHSELESAVQILGEQVRAEKSAKAAEMEEMDKRWVALSSALLWGSIQLDIENSVEYFC